ncbi:MAG: thiamine-phosphate kinase [Rhodospirillaceae bacterium]|nr:thiamine-phosphate kinase [Rhodospirillaceae bacterium]
MKRPGEFDLIAKYFAPLAAAMPGAAGLGNDGATFAPTPGHEIVVTVDALTEGVHFLPDDPPGDIARKMLRVNLSDLAAMGARPVGYVMTTALSDRVDEAWIASFTAGLAADQKEFDIGLLGGDTTATPGPIALTLTAFGEVASGRELLRSAAKAGDLIFVSGAIGDGLLGLMALRDQIPGIAAEDRDALGVRYRLPQPRLALGVALTERGLSRCAIDVSDGLVADLGHIARQSQLAAEIRADKVPLSSAARRAIEGDPSLLLRALTGGDDYELLFTVAPDKRDAVAGLARELDLPLTEIGSMKWGEDVRVVDAHGRALTLGDSGWRHF